MTEVLVTCEQCANEIAVRMDAAILRTDVEPHAAAELLFCCPECGLPTVRPIVGDLLTLLLLVGVEPLRLSEPSLAPEDVPPDVPPLTRDDLLEWHEQLQGIRFITPWEK